MAQNFTNDELIQSVRRRPGMYFGSVGAKGVEHFVYELVANAIDAYLAGDATWVQVNLDGGTISVSDDGPGLPFDEPSETEGMSLAELALTQVHWTRSQDSHAPHIHLTPLGLGLAVLNVASSQLTVQSWRSGSLWEQRFSQGIAQGPAVCIEHCGEQGEARRGTAITVTPDADIFGESQPRVSHLRRILFETAHLFGGLRVGFQSEWFCAADGLRSLGEMLLSPDVVAVKSFPPFHARVQEEGVWLEAVAVGAADGEERSALASSGGLPRTIRSWVNGTQTFEHGSHVEGFLQALQAVDWQPVLILIHVVMYEPEFAGPAKERLDVPQIEEMIKRVLGSELQQHYFSQ